MAGKRTIDEVIRRAIRGRPSVYRGLRVDLRVAGQLFGLNRVQRIQQEVEDSLQRRAAGVGLRRAGGGAWEAVGRRRTVVKHCDRPFRVATLNVQACAAGGLHEIIAALAGEGLHCALLQSTLWRGKEGDWAYSGSVCCGIVAAGLLYTSDGVKRDIFWKAKQVVAKVQENEDAGTIKDLSMVADTAALPSQDGMKQAG